MEDLRLKYRPKTLDEVWGQEHIKMFWNSCLRKGDFPPSIILHSNYGMGKTTLAEIFARDIVRVRGGCNFTKHNSPRCDFAIIHKMLRKCSPQEALIMWPEVHLFEEAQQMPDKAQDGFLMIMDDNPFLNFIFATTDLTRIDEGLQARSDIFQLTLPSKEVLMKELGRISTLEQIRIENDALDYLIEFSNHNPRNCLGNLRTVSRHDSIIDVRIAKDLLSK